MRRLPVIATVSASALVLAACGSGGGAEDGGGEGLTVVTSTNVYASLAEAVAGDAAEVTPVITDAAQDPHEYEATARDQLTLSRADLVVMNGGGYDSYMQTMLDAVETDPEVIDAVSISGLPGADGAEDAHDHEHAEDEAAEDESAAEEGVESERGTEPEESHAEDEHSHAGGDVHEHGEDDGHDHAHDEGEDADHAHEDDGHDHAHESEDAHDHAEESEDAHDHADEGDHADDDHGGHSHGPGTFNEHVWYSVPTMVKVVDELEAHLSELSPDDATAFSENAEAIRGELDGLTQRTDELKAAHEGEHAAVTEPVALWLFEDMGLENAISDDFVYAVEAGSDVSPIVLRDALSALEDDDVQVLVYNSQTSGPEAEELRERAEELGIPVVEMLETVPAEQSYSEWMSANIDELEQALS